MSAWNDFTAAHSVGDVVQGEVVSVVPFGAFVEVAGVHGALVTTDAPAMGSQVSVRILAIDAERQRFSLEAV